MKSPKLLSQGNCGWLGQLFDECYWQSFSNVYLLTVLYHISKNLTSSCKLYVKVKYLISKDEKKIKRNKVWKIVMTAWEHILDFDLEETYLWPIHLFKIVGYKIDQICGICGRYNIGIGEREFA